MNVRRGSLPWIPKLVEVLESGCPEAQGLSVSALWQLASLPEARTAIVRAGGVKHLVNVITTLHVEDVQSSAAALLAELAEARESHSELVSSGAVPLLIFALSGPEVGVNADMQRHAAAVLYPICNSSSFRRLLIDGGIVPPLLALTSAEDGSELQGYAIAMIKCLADDAAARGAIEEAGGAEILRSVSPSAA